MTQHPGEQHASGKDRRDDHRGTTRRAALAAFGGAGLGAAAFGLTGTASAVDGQRPATGGGSRTAPSCILTPEQMEGPYYLDYGILREDITEDKDGIDLLMRIVVVDASSCRPLPNIAVDVWHCDALGIYSSYTGYDDGQLPPVDETGHATPTDRTTWLRGVQLTDARGVVTFRSIVPGWYSGRTTHVHVKTIVGGHREDGSWEGGHTSHTGQLYFPEDFNEKVATTAPYKHNSAPRTTNRQDFLFTGGNEGPATLMDIGPSWVGAPGPGVSGAVVLGIDPSATPPPEGLPPGSGRHLPTDRP